MQASDFHKPTLPDHCTLVLEAYQVRDAANRAASSEYAGWMDRIIRLDGMTAGELTSAHGFLIAEGMLRFEITGRSVGLQYQISSSGRELLRRAAIMGQDPEDDAAASLAAESDEEHSAAA
ncbi:MAG: hypothetical protein KDA85_17055 [Planctomycetaceae bacterium]|nr:hypothetical protein [Planctomycetaceae bacterium]